LRQRKDKQGQRKNSSYVKDEEETSPQERKGWGKVGYGSGGYGDGDSLSRRFFQ